MNKIRGERETKRVRERTPVWIVNTLQERTGGIINMIFSGESTGGDSLGKRKAHVRYIFSVAISRHPSYQPITFTSKNRERVSYPYNDPMVVIANIDGFIVKRFLIDSGSSCNVLT